MSDAEQAYQCLGGVLSRTDDVRDSYALLDKALLDTALELAKGVNGGILRLGIAVLKGNADRLEMHGHLTDGCFRGSTEITGLLTKCLSGEPASADASRLKEHAGTLVNKTAEIDETWSSYGRRMAALAGQLAAIQTEVTALVGDMDGTRITINQVLGVNKQLAHETKQYRDKL